MAVSRPIVCKGGSLTRLAWGGDPAAAHHCVPWAHKARRSRGSDGGPMDTPDSSHGASVRVLSWVSWLRICISVQFSHVGQRRLRRYGVPPLHPCHRIPRIHHQARVIRHQLPVVA